jgi:predicted HicB family RNase H-like nuclease
METMREFIHQKMLKTSGRHNMAKRKSGITIYPDAELQKKLEKEAQKQRRSLNNFILFILASFFSKEHGKK